MVLKIKLGTVFLGGGEWEGGHFSQKVKGWSTVDLSNEVCTRDCSRSLTSVNVINGSEFDLHCILTAHFEALLNGV